MDRQLHGATGTVFRMLNRHDDTNISIYDVTVQAGQHIGVHHHPTHTETRTFINQSRNYSAIFEMDGDTYKFTDRDHIVLTAGDEVRIVWYLRADGLRKIVAMSNVSRRIARRAFVDAQTPLINGLAGAVVLCVASALFGLGWFFFPIIAAGAAYYCWRTIGRRNKHAAIINDFLAGKRERV
jgi:hypothetical protein